MGEDTETGTGRRCNCRGVSLKTMALVLQASGSKLGIWGYI